MAGPDRSSREGPRCPAGSLTPWLRFFSGRHPLGPTMASFFPIQAGLASFREGRGTSWVRFGKREAGKLGSIWRGAPGDWLRFGELPGEEIGFVSEAGRRD